MYALLGGYTVRNHSPECIEYGFEEGCIRSEHVLGVEGDEGQDARQNVIQKE